jgi:hypothetical protein
VRPVNRSPEQNSHTTENSGCGSEEPSNQHVSAAPPFDATSTAEQLFDHALHRAEVVGDGLDALGAIQQIGQVLGQFGPVPCGRLDGVGELGGMRGGE